MPASSAAQGQDNVHGLSVIERMVHRRAVEAAVWSLPLINFKAMRDAQASLGAGYNDVAYYSKIQTWQFQIATPNNTTPYIISFWNLADGPVVVELPPSTPDVGIFGTLMDSWQRPLEDVGAKGYDKGRGGKYLLLPPDYRGGFPAGYIPLQQATYQGFTILRPIIADASDENLAKAAAFAKSIKVYPFAKAGGEAQTRYVDLAGKLFDGIVDFDAGFYEHLSAIVQEETVPGDELAMMGLLKSIGIQKGVDFAPDERTKEILGAAASEAHEYLVQRYHEGNLPVWYDGKHWMSIVPPGTVETGFSFRFPGYVDYDFRGALYYAVCTSAKHLGGATFYLTAAQDADGMWLDGGSTYKFTVAADVPVEDFWSVVAYDVKSAAWILEQPKVGLDSIDKAVQASPDGSVDIYFGPEAPAGKEGNWVPTVAGRRFFLLFRFYGPKPAVFTKTWVLNDLVKIK
jgi:hypothetical protein